MSRTTRQGLSPHPALVASSLHTRRDRPGTITTGPNTGRTARSLTTVALLSAVIAAPAPPDDARAAVEKKLVGEWVKGGACIGDITIRADGTFERRHYSPGNYT